MAFEELKQKQSVMWGNGPYERVTDTLGDAHDVVVGKIAAQPRGAVARSGDAGRVRSRRSAARPAPPSRGSTSRRS